jgi:hypothetical protein
MLLLCSFERGVGAEKIQKVFAKHAAQAEAYVEVNQNQQISCLHIIAHKPAK